MCYVTIRKTDDIYAELSVRSELCFSLSEKLPFFLIPEVNVGIVGGARD